MGVTSLRRYDAKSAEVAVYTFKEGFLSRVAHDLKLLAESFTLDVDDTTAELTLDANSLKVFCVMQEGKEAPPHLSASQHTDIEKNLAKDVLHADRFPTINFRSTQLGPKEIKGSLTLCGKTREVRGDRWEREWGVEAKFTIAQPDFGIVPYSAMLGAIRVKPEVVVVVRLGAPRT